MAVETANFINQLVETAPAGTEFKYEGDDHLRVIKNAVKGSFPNFTGVAIGYTETQLNTVASRVLATSSFGDIVSYNVGTTVGTIPSVVDVSGTPGLPALDGSQLTGISTTDTLVSDIPIMTLKNAKVKLYFYGQL